LNRAEILDEITKTLVEVFQLDPKIVTPEARLVEDLDLDSIDAIDLAVKVQDLTGKRLAEDDLRSLSTIEDLVAVVEKMLREQTSETVRET
jgi:acyl carrier protein